MQSTFGGKSELYRRIAFTLGALAIYRLGRYIPLPGIDPRIVAEIFRRQPSQFLDILNGSSVRALGRLSVCALGIAPYLSASFMILLATAFSRRLRGVLRGDNAARCARVLAVVLAAIEAYGLARGLEARRGTAYFGPVVEPGLVFRATTIMTIATGSAFLIWLADEITRRGLGNGIALMLFADIATRMPGNFHRLFAESSAGYLPTEVVRTAVIALAVLVALIALIESAKVRIRVRYAIPRGVGPPFDVTSSLTFKLNNTGIVPIYFSGQILLLPATIRDTYHLQDGFIADLASVFQWGSWNRVAAGAAVITILCFVYVALVLSPKAMAQDLQRHRGLVPDMALGQSTADHLDRVLTWTTLVGALYLWAVSMLPSYIASIYSVPLEFGGASLMVVVCVAMDTLCQARAHLPVVSQANRSDDRSYI